MEFTPPDPSTGSRVGTRSYTKPKREPCFTLLNAPLIKTLPLPGGNHNGWLNTLLGEEKQQRSGQPLALLPDK